MIFHFPEKWSFTPIINSSIKIKTKNPDCTSAVEPPFTPDQIHHSQDLDPASQLCGSETWILTKREENQLLVFERKVFRTICGPKIENGAYRRRYNHKPRQGVSQPECPKCHEDEQIALSWSHDQKTRRPTTKRSIQSQTQWKEKSRKTEFLVGGWGEKRKPSSRCQILNALCSRQADMERSSSTGLN
jgi:hypothetical protein